jgi:aminoglycoside phosphotransferase (APT) family kinase protein
MSLPPFPEVSPAALRAIAERHGLSGRTFEPLSSRGVFNAVYLLDDDLVLRVPRNHPHFVAALTKEAIAVPAARAAGVRTPRLVVYDDSLALLPVPYALYERVHGQALESLGLDPSTTPAVYRALGRDLARLHAGVSPDGPAGQLGTPNLPRGDPRALPGELAAAGYFSVTEARWLEQWLNRLPPILEMPHARRFLHGDTQATNVLVRPDPLEYLALVDWGGCGWGDPALDFSGMPLRAVPDVLAGYREIAPLVDDESAEARILGYHLHFALVNVRNAPQPLRSWGERPLGYLLEVMHLMLEPPGGRWAELRPGRNPCAEARLPKEAGLVPGGPSR